ncbi:MAG: HAMP domain-containing protein [Methylococcaceae bacterium]|nr:HAMP domain-containing protein [Methylococcaceae bacterium]
MFKKALAKIRRPFSEEENNSTARNLFLPIAIKLAVIYSFILILGMVMLSAFIESKQTEILEKQALRLGEILVFQAVYSLKTPLLANSPTGIQTVIDKLKEEESIVGVTIYNKDQVVIKSNGFIEQPISFPTEEQAYSLHIDVLENTLININKVITYTVAVKYDVLLIGYLSVSFEETALGESRKEILHVLILLMFSGLLLCIIAAFFLSKHVTKPLYDLMHASSVISNQQGLGNDDNPHNFKRKTELERLMESLNKMNTGLLQKDRVEAVFSRYVSAQVAKEVLKDLDSLEEVEMGGEHIMASVFFADIVGFTSLSESMEPKDISNLLNVYFSKITEVVSFCTGHVDKFIGDCAMVVFGVPMKNEQHAFDCAACSWMIMQLLHELNRRREAKGLLTVEFRIGTNSGMMLAGNMGSSERMEYTVVGDSVNLASRLCGTGEPGEIIMTEDVFVEQSLEGFILTEDKDFIRLRGKKLPVKTLVITDILTPFKQKMLDEIPLIIERGENNTE